MIQDLKYKLTLQDLFTSKMKGAIGQTEKLDSKMNKLAETSKRAGNGGGAFGGVGKMLGGVAIGAGVVAFGKATLDSLVNYEYFSASLRTLLKGDEKSAKALQGQLVSLAKETPFSLVEIQDATKQLLAYGFAGKDVTANIRMLGDVAIGLKIPFGDIAYLYGTLKTQGRAFSKDINQFTSRGIPIVKELAKQFGVADSKVMELVQDGKVGFPEVEKAFKSMTAEGGMFFDMMKQQTATTGGQLSALGDSWEQLKVNIGKSQTGIINGTISFFNKMIGSISDYYATVNRMEETQNKFGKKEKGFKAFMSSATSVLSFGLLGRGFTDEQRQYDESINKRVSGEKTLVENLKLKALLLKGIVLELNKIKKGSSTLENGTFKIATLKGALQTIQGNIDLAGKKEETSLLPEGSENAKKEAEKSSTEISGSKPQTINISINKLVETLKIETQTIKEGTVQMKAMVAEALMEAVNDLNYITK